MRNSWPGLRRVVGRAQGADVRAWPARWNPRTGRAVCRWGRRPSWVWPRWKVSALGLTEAFGTGAAAREIPAAHVAYLMARVEARLPMGGGDGFRFANPRDEISGAAGTSRWCIVRRRGSAGR